MHNIVYTVYVEWREAYGWIYLHTAPRLDPEENSPALKKYGDDLPDLSVN
jgi:hypothetical protein